MKGFLLVLVGLCLFGTAAYLLKGFILMRILSTPEPRLEETVTVSGAFTAAEGHKAVEHIAIKWAPDAYLDIVNVAGNLSKRDTDGPLIGMDGRSAPHGGWGYRFISANLRRGLYLRVDAEGRVKAATFTLDTFGLPFEPQDYPALPDGWMDSSEAVRIAEENGGREFRQGKKMYDLIFNLGHNRKRLWQLTYITCDQTNGRRDFIIDVDPSSGRVVAKNMRP